MNYYRQTRIILLHENNMLRAENRSMRQALAFRPSCRCCNEPNIQAEERGLELENALLRSELDTLNCFAERLSSCRALFPAAGATSLWRYAVAAMTSLSVAEVVSLARRGSPMWINNERLNVEEYYSQYFPWFARNAPGFVHEASRASALVPCNASLLVNNLMTSENWSNIFPAIIGDASLKSQHQEFQLINVEYMPQISLIKTRNVKLLRCSKSVENDTWVIADMSLYFTSYERPLRPDFMRFPSGILVQHITNAVSKVTVLDHWVYQKDQVINYYNSGFGAHRCLLALQRHCYNTWFILIPSFGHHIEFFEPTRRTNLINLSTFMVYVFCTGACGITGQNWKRLRMLGFTLNNIRMLTQESRDMSGVPCVLVSTTGSVKLQDKPDEIFGLINGSTKGDIWSYLKSVGEMNEVIRIKRSLRAGNEVDVFSFQTGFKDWYLVEETYLDGSGAMIIHACIEAPSLEAVMNGGDLSSVELLPCGFTIMRQGSEGSVVSAGCQVKTGQTMVTSSDRLVSYLEDMVNGTIGNLQNALLGNP